MSITPEPFFQRVISIDTFGHMVRAWFEDDALISVEPIGSRGPQIEFHLEDEHDARSLAAALNVAADEIEWRRQARSELPTVGALGEREVTGG